MTAGLEKVFPQLAGSGYEVTSPPTPQYNCIAWAAGEDSRWWWPGASPQSYWPEGIPNEVTVPAFIQAYALLGYEKCDDASSEVGFEKIAIFAGPDGEPTHAALQSNDGWWTSKLGQSGDIRHRLESLEGTAYGRMVVCLRRPRG